MLDVSGFPVTEVKLTNIFARVEVITAGFNKVTIRLPVWSHSMIAVVVFVFVVFVLTVAVIVR